MGGRALDPGNEHTDRQVALVVPSCDAYSDLWEPFVAMLRLRWPHCPFVVYLVNNGLPFESDGVVLISVGRDLGWSANLINALRRIPEEYVFLFIDDLFLRSNVEDDVVLRLIRRCVSNNWDYLRLNPTPGPTTSSDGIGLVPPGDWYRCATTMSIWKKSVLSDVLRPEETAWDFEIFGGDRTDKYLNWYASTLWNLPFHNLVIKGKIDPQALSKLNATGLYLKTSRPVMSSMEVGLLALRRGRSRLMNVVPRNVRRRVRALFASH